MTYTPKTKEERKKEWDALQQQILDGVEAVFKSENYRNFLRFFSGFHRYSINNAILIHLQFPEAQKIASYDTWRKKKHRQVKPGSKGIQILVPTPVKVKKDEDGKEKVQEIMRFKRGFVFDISQTYPIDELGEVPVLCRNLEGNPDGLDGIIQKITDDLSVPVMYEHMKDGCNGYYRIDSHQIYLSQNLSFQQEVKTLLHEYSHHLQETKYQEEMMAITNATKELVAESCAYTAIQSLSEMTGMDIDSSEFSFPYIASWAQDQSLKDLKSVLGLIGKISDEMISTLETILLSAPTA